MTLYPISESATSSAEDMAASTANNDSASVYKDLIEFLQSTRADLRLEATKAVLQVVSDRQQVLQLMEHGVLLPLLRIISDTSTGNDTCAENALRAILYLSSSVDQITNQCVEELLSQNAVPRLIEVVMGIPASAQQQSPASLSIVNLALAILANLTRTESGAVTLVGKTLPDEAVKEIDPERSTEKPTMTLLLDRFLNRELIQSIPDYSSLEPHEWDTLSDDPYQHFAAILMNATQLESGRRFVLRIPQINKGSNEQPKSVFEKLLSQLMYSPNPIRRRGISGMIRNCCLEKEAAWWMLNVAKMLTPVLYPLAGPEELDLDEKQGMDPDLWLEGPDKVRDIDSATRQNAVDTILLLCATGRQSRKTLRLARTYVVLKYADMVEESETISDRINECVQYLRRDEEGTQEGSSDQLIEEVYTPASKLKLLPSSQVSAGVDYDDVD